MRIDGFGFDLAVNPAFGGRIDRLDYQGTPILRPSMHLDDPEPLNSSSFPLVPFSNRIRHGKFSYRGRHHSLPSNWTGDEHTIHGEGWKRPWTMRHHDQSSITMGIAGAEYWPWDYDAVQTISLAKQTVHFELSVTNKSDTPMLAGIGMHPYFSRDEDTRLSLGAEHCWAPMSEGPMRTVQRKCIGTAEAAEPVGGLNLDHCFEAWDGLARIEHPSRGLAVDVTALKNAPHAVVYTPPNEPYFCLEPVSQLTGAFDFPTTSKQAPAELKPGASLTLAFRITVSEL